MAIWLARYHGGVGFSLAVSLTFLALIVHQRSPLKQLPEPPGMAQQAELTAPVALNVRDEKAYANRWREMATQYYAQHPLTDESQIQERGEQSPIFSAPSPTSPKRSASVSLASHQQSSSDPATAKPLVTAMPSPAAVTGSSATRSAIATVIDLGIGGLLASLSSATVAFIFFHAAWPIAVKPKTSKSSQDLSRPAQRVGQPDNAGMENELRIELPVAWVQTPRSFSDTLRTVTIAASYLAVLGALYMLSIS